MALKIQRSFRRVFIKVTAIILAIFVLGVIGLYIWFVNNSKKLLIELVTEKSAGKLKLELSDINFDFFSSEVKIHKATIRSTIKDNTPITYQVSFREVVLHTNSIWSLLIKRAVEIRQIKLYDPTIEVVNLQKDSISNSNNNLSLGAELGKLYNSIQEAIAALKTHSIYVINAKLILNNKMEQAKSPVIFSNIYFTIKKLNKRKGSRGRFSDSNNIIFSSSDQDISLTDGIHKLLFKKLVLQKARNIILDSCTIIALPTQASGNSYNIQFKRLALIGVDFDTLYKTNLIKADSVYCENPYSTINLNPGSRDRNSAGKGLPDLEKILKEFSGNLDLGFIGVKNADIHVNITSKRGRSNINSGKGNFQIKNLRINPDSSKLISIKSFDMLIKGYLLYNADSSCNYSFDSIRFANDKLLLNNFSVHTSSGVNTIRNYRDYSMPYFELLGLDWPELIFKQNLKATEAVLHDPTINFTKSAKVNVLKKSLIFNSRHTFDDFMELERLKIIDGKINIKWGSANFLQLEGLNLSLLPNNLKSYHYTDVKLQKDVESLFFSGGYFKIGDINARVRNVLFNANDQIHAEEVLINSSRKEIDSKINDVSIKNIYSEPNGSIVIDGLTWEHGNILVSSMPHPETGNKQTSFLLKNISGKQTPLKLSNSGYEGDAFIENVQIASLAKKDNRPMTINGFKLRGKEIHLSNSLIRINSESFLLSDNSQEFSKARFEHINKAGTLNITTPYLQLTGNINSFFDGDHHLDYVLLKSPAINFLKQNTSPVTAGKISSLPVIKIDHISILEPVITAQVLQPLSSLNFSLPYSKGGEIKAGDVQIAPAGITVGTLDIKAKKAEISKGTEKVLKIDNGIDANLSKINISLAGDSLSWGALVNKLNVESSDGFTFNIKENRLELKDMALGDCLISSSSVNDINTFISSNHAARLATSGVKYYSKNAIWQGFNASYDAGRNILSLDSFNYHPRGPRDSVIASSPYQIDYLSFSCSDTKLSGFDLIKYLKEQALTIQKASIRRPSISIYRDKFPPYLSGIVKKLFVKQIMDIRQPVSINQIEIDDGKASYTEKNARTRQEGNLMLTHLNGNIFNIKNFDIKAGDSLSLVFTGHLLNAAFFNLKLNESYSDPLYGFLMALKIEPAPLTFLNPLLAPLSNIKLKSGRIDTFYMSAVGNENLARGEMRFYYHGLHLQLLKNGETPKSTSIKNVGSLLVNTFVVRTNNGRKNGLIYFKRLKDRSFFNYMNKIIFSGVATSVGAKKNSQYRKDLINNKEPHENP